ncbi:MAG: TetR/AcrR family transcriptional regulator [Planctomycetes bacterium]|nr:TetR/AcrR family transcriptional regulator [Planctomycetota bacterium]
MNNAVDLGRDTHAAILQAAADLFAERGFDAVSVREIVAAAGLTKPALYYHFGNKEGLARAIVEGLAGRADAIRRAAFAECADARAAITRTTAEMLDLAQSERAGLAFSFSLLFGRSGMASLLGLVNEYHARVWAEWHAYLLGTGLSEPQAGRVVRLLWALLMQELLRVAHCPQWKGDREQTAREIASLVLDGALAPQKEHP